jgi:hypothetical protein
VSLQPALHSIQLEPELFTDDQARRVQCGSAPRQLPGTEVIFRAAVLSTKKKKFSGAISRRRGILLSSLEKFTQGI